MNPIRTAVAVALASFALSAAAQPPGPEKMQEHREKMQALCQSDPQACEAKKKEMREKAEQRREDMRAKCEADPKACEQKRKEMHERMEKRHDAMRPGASDASRGAGDHSGHGAPAREPTRL